MKAVVLTRLLEVRVELFATYRGPSLVHADTCLQLVQILHPLTDSISLLLWSFVAFMYDLAQSDSRELALTLLFFGAECVYCCTRWASVIRVRSVAATMQVSLVIHCLLCLLTVLFR